MLSRTCENMSGWELYGVMRMCMLEIERQLMIKPEDELKVWGMSEQNTEREVVLALGDDKFVSVPLADAVAEYFRLRTSGEGDLDDSEKKALAALEIALSTLVISDGARRIYTALEGASGPPS